MVSKKEFKEKLLESEEKISKFIPPAIAVLDSEPNSIPGAVDFELVKQQVAENNASVKSEVLYETIRKMIEEVCKETLDKQPIFQFLGRLQDSVQSLTQRIDELEDREWQIFNTTVTSSTPTSSVEPVIYSASFHDKTVGSISAASLLSQTGLVLLRGTVGTAQTSDSSVVTGIAVDTGRIGQRTALSTSRGLLIEESRRNVVQSSREMNTTWWTLGSAAHTNDYAAGPDSVVNAERSNAASGEVGRYLNLSGLTAELPNTSSSVGSYWVRSTAGTTNHQGYCATNGSLVYIITASNISTTWQRVSALVPSIGLNQVLLAPVISDDLTAFGGYAAFAQDVVTDMYQVELGKFATELISSSNGYLTRDGERLYHPNISALGTSGRLSLEFRFIPKGSSTQYGSNQQIWFVDSDNQVYINNTNQKVVVVVNGTSTTLTTAITWSQYDVVDLFIGVGGNTMVATGSYRVNEGTTNLLGYSSMPEGSINLTGNIDIFCSGTQKQMTSWLQSFKAYTAGYAPDWV